MVVRREDGSASTVVLGLCLGTLALGTALALGAGLTVRSHSVSRAAEAGALAAAEALNGRRSGEPCAEAARFVAAGDARLTQCRVDGTSVRVQASGGAGLLIVTGRARAGPVEGP